jgi:hypothetical protein
MQHATLRSSGPARAALGRASSRPQRRATVVARASAKDPADNLREAQEWVARWRARQAAAGSSGARTADAEADAPAAAAPSSPSKGGKLQPCKSFSDGTLLFTADSLKSVKFGDVKL